MEVRSVTETLNLIDPLVDDSSISFFPRATKFSTLANSSLVDTLYKARVSSSPDKLLKQAKTILEGGMDHVGTDKTKAVNTENKGRRERRPGLGIAQAKFTMRPMSSQPDENLESSFDISKSDPVEFFADFERKEKARMEVRRLNGQPLYDFDPNQPLAPRPRRPSLLGSTATYKHRSYPVLSLEKETFDKDIPSSTPDDVLQDSNVMNDSPSVKMSDSKSKTSEVTKLFDLLPLVEGLDENGVQNLLQEKLNIKDVDIGKIVLPEWRVPLPDSVFNLSGAGKAVRNRNQTSPGKLKSPLASISSLSRHITKRTPSREPFSPLNIDLSPAEAIDPSTKPERRMDLARQSGKGSFVSVLNEIGPLSDPREKEGVVGQVAQIGNINELENLPIHGEERIVVSNEDSILSPSMDVGRISEPEIQEDEVDAAWVPVKQLNFDGVMENSSFSGVESGMHEPSNTENNSVKEPAKEPGRASKRRIEEKGELEVPFEAVISEGIVKERGETKTSESDVFDSRETRSKRTKVDGARGQKKSDRQLRRFSLYDAGTKWEAGVRRSSRIRMRPLQFWKGERFLYGRVNESLATVIGVKYASPSKCMEESEIKVKSFVSDEHKDLLKFYSLY